MYFHFKKCANFLPKMAKNLSLWIIFLSSIKSSLFPQETIFDSAAKHLGLKIHYEKYHQNTLAKNKDGLYGIFERRISSPFSSNLKNGGFCSRIKNKDLTPFSAAWSLGRLLSQILPPPLSPFRLLFSGGLSGNRKHRVGRALKASSWLAI